MAEIGSVIAGKYEILTEIGHGGMSVVYLAMDTHLNKQWAVKEIRKKGNGRNDEVIVNSLLAEANMMKRLDHPSLPTDPLGYVESYEYDKNGNMTSKTDRDGYTINFTYGSHGKIEEIVYADGKTVEMSYDALRRLNEVKDWNGITKITLDAIGRALSVTEPNGDTVGYEWGLMGEKKAVIYPNGKRAEYSYNTEMQLVSLHTERETIQYAYDEIGRLTKKILPNGIETNYHYNAMGRVDEISHIGNEFAESYKYSFDIYGNKVSAIKNRVGAEVDNGHFAYVYDELNRLTEVHQNDTLLRKYSYDAFGNRVSKANYASRMESVTSYTYNVNNQLLSEVDGTMTKDYTYDNRGNLLKVSTGADILKEFAGTSGVVEFGGDLLDQKVLQKKEDLDYTHAISNGLWSATTTLVVGGITNEISNVIHPEAKTGTMDYLFGRDKAKAVVKAQYNNARSSSSRAKYWNRLEKIKLQKTLGTIKYGIIETGKTIIDEIKTEIYRDEVNEDIVEEIDKKISCSVY